MVSKKQRDLNATKNQVIAMPIEDKRELDNYRKIVPSMTKYLDNYIVSQLEYITRLSLVQKYDEKVWLNQYEIEIKRGNDKKIEALASELNIRLVNLTVEDKKEMGFHFYCEYLNYLYSEVEKMKKLTGSKLFYFKNKDRGEYIELFGTPMNLNQLEKTYQKLNDELKAQSLDCEDDSLKARYAKAVIELRDIRKLLKDNWDKKCDGLNPSIDDRKLKLVKLKSSILKGYLGKPVVNSKKPLRLTAGR